MSLRPFYRSLFVAIFIAPWIASAPGLTMQHDEASRGESDTVAVAASVGAGPECRLSADCVSDPLRPICDNARCVGCQNDAQCTAERPGMTKCALADELGAEIGQCLPCSPYATCRYGSDPVVRRSRRRKGYEPWHSRKAFSHADQSDAARASGSHAEPARQRVLSAADGVSGLLLGHQRKADHCASVRRTLRRLRRRVPRAAPGTQRRLGAGARGPSRRVAHESRV